MRVAIAVGILLVAVCIVIATVDSNRFHTVSYHVGTKKVDRPFHFVFLSDLHNKCYGKQNEKLLAAIDRIAPDAVLIGGDILTAKPGASLETAIHFVSSLAQHYTVYYANGNHEQRLKLYPEKYGSMAEEYERAMAGIGIRRLVNESRMDAVHKVQITGCEIDRQYYKRFQKICMDSTYLLKILPPACVDTFQIVLAHNPDYFDAYAAWGADLVLSGHVHGGVARLPGLGGVISPSCRLFPKYDGGLFRRGDSTMIISRGLGAHTIPLRFLNPAELVEITIEPRQEDAPKERKEVVS